VARRAINVIKDSDRWECDGGSGRRGRTLDSLLMESCGRDSYGDFEAPNRMIRSIPASSAGGLMSGDLERLSAGTSHGGRRASRLPTADRSAALPL